MKIKTIPELCTSCNMCAYICSIKKLGVINYRKAAIRIFNKLPYPEIEILSNCDLCKSEEEPWCVKYCFPGALYMEGKE